MDHPTPLVERSYAMTGRSRRQLVLELNYKGTLRLAAERSPELVQALADLLLEALGEDGDVATPAIGGSDESEDHA
jgi:hypothetical protein